MTRLYKKVQPMVYKALVDHPETRADDFKLVLTVYKQFVSGDMNLKTVLEHHTELGLPSFASIVRTRRKLQRQLCGETRSVKYTVYLDAFYADVPCCNKCALMKGANDGT